MHNMDFLQLILIIDNYLLLMADNNIKSDNLTLWYFKKEV